MISLALPPRLASPVTRMDDTSLLFIDGCDDALIGIVRRCASPDVACYDYDKLVDVFIAQGMTEEEAEAILGKSVWQAQGKVPAVWPTPVSSTSMAEDISTVRARLEDGKPYKSRLIEAVAMWPTPRAAQGETRNHTIYLRSMDKPQNLENKIATVDPTTIGGKLNPMWVEWLMGFPLGWTDLEASETQ